MVLPIRFRNVHYYRIAGKYIFAGDLFITRGNLYFFPEVDLAEQREEIGHVVPHELGLLLAAVVYVAQKIGSYHSRVDFWTDRMPNEAFQKQAAVYIEGLKLNRSNQAFGKILPLPTHVRSAEVSDIRLTSLGKLSFSAQSDNHDFKVGLRRQRLLRDALWEAGLGRF
jgi:hypothetical protein